MGLVSEDNGCDVESGVRVVDSTGGSDCCNDEVVEKELPEAA